MPDDIPDPRPAVAGDPPAVLGQKCADCGHATARRVARCPRCASQHLNEDSWTEGTVWSTTLVHIPVGDRVPPYRLTYVDLADGPRVLAHQRHSGGPAPALGLSVHVVGINANGDLEVSA